MKTIEIICVVCTNPYSYPSKGGRKRKTCDNSGCENMRANFTRARSRARERGEVKDYSDKIRPTGLTVKTQERIEQESDAWREFQSNRRPQSGSCDIDFEGWEAHTDVDDDGHQVFGSDAQDEYEGVPTAEDWVPTVRRATLADGFVADDYRDDSDAVREIRNQRKLVDDWYQRTTDAPPKTALNVGTTVLDPVSRPLGVRGSAVKPEPIKAPSAATLQRWFGARPERIVNTAGTVIVIRPVSALTPFVWDASASDLPEVPLREHEWGVSYVMKQGESRGLIAEPMAGALGDGRDWSRWITTDPSAWYD